MGVALYRVGLFGPYIARGFPDFFLFGVGLSLLFGGDAGVHRLLAVFRKEEVCAGEPLGFVALLESPCLVYPAASEDRRGAQGTYLEGFKLQHHAVCLQSAYEGRAESHHPLPGRVRRRHHLPARIHGVPAEEPPDAAKDIPRAESLSLSLDLQGWGEVRHRRFLQIPDKKQPLDTV